MYGCQLTTMIMSESGVKVVHEEAEGLVRFQKEKVVKNEARAADSFDDLSLFDRKRTKSNLLQRTI